MLFVNIISSFFYRDTLLHIVEHYIKKYGHEKLEKDEKKCKF